MTRALVWFRRDLRCHDHAALYHALRNHTEVYCGFVFDTDILNALPHRNDCRVAFIHASVRHLHEALKALARSQTGARKWFNRTPRPRRGKHRGPRVGVGSG